MSALPHGYEFHHLSANPSELMFICSMASSIAHSSVNLQVFNESIDNFIARSSNDDIINELEDFRKYILDKNSDVFLKPQNDYDLFAFDQSKLY